MYLKSLVLKGFKSFADRSVISLEPGITAIVGPNGSGKSNVSDAVLWVLGERNAKNLRGQAMEDVIFAGSSARKATGMAEVDLILDNSDGTLPIDYTEVAITRRMYRNGESEYLINGTPARRMDVLDILHDTGLGTGTHSIIAQGHLSSILSSKPEDRRALIEEAAGVLKHKQRKVKSERKLERMDAHLTRVRDIVTEVERQIRPLERKAKRAIAYREVANELAGLNLDLAVDDLRVLQGKWDATITREKELTEQVETTRSEISRTEELAESLQAKLASEASGAGALAAQYRRMQAAVDRLESNILLLREKKRSAETYLAEMELAADPGAGTDASLEQARMEADNQLTQSRLAAEQAQEVLRQAQASADEADRARKSLQAEIDAAIQRRREAMQDLEGARAQYARTQEVLAESRAQEKMIDTQVGQLAERTSAAKLARETAAEADTKLAAQLAEAKAHEAKIREDIGNATSERDDVRARLEAAREVRATLSAEVKSLEELERARSKANPLLAWVLDHASDIQAELSPLVDEVSAPADLEPVVEQLLGSDIAALFVRDTETAALLAARLAGTDEAGQITLLPRVGMRTTSSAREGRLIDLLTINEAARDAVEALLGDVVVCESTDQALRIAQTNQGVCAVTRSGAIAWPNGKLSYTRRDSQAASALSTHRSLEEARKALEDAIADQDMLEQRIVHCEESLRTVQSQGLEATAEVARLQGAAESSALSAQQALQIYDELVAETQALDAQRAAAREALEKAAPDAEQLTNRIEQLTERIDEMKTAIDDMTDQMASVVVEAERTLASLNEARVAASGANQQAEYAQRILLAREQDIRNAMASQARAQESIRRRKIAVKRSEPLIELHRSLADAATNRMRALEEVTAQSQSSTSGLHTQINDARIAARAARDAFDTANGQLADIRVEKGRLEMQVEAAINTITEECATPLETALELPELEQRAEVEERAFKLRRRIQNMGTINPDAAFEYEQLKTRYDYLRGQLDDMESARRSLTSIVRVIDERMKDDFVRTFDEVNQNYQEIFTILFPGGSGNLSLVNPDDPENTGVEVNAQPSGKRILKMSLMSGGEQSLVALALLFAVYKTRSTPFYILDEVEAALDDTNLRRLCAYLDSMRNDTQFIMITHQRRTMEMADVLYGISMQSDGVTKVMSQRLDKALRYAEG